MIAQSINNNNNSSDVENKEVYKDKEEKLVLALLLELYPKFNTILVDTNRYSFYSILYCLLSTYTTNYCSNQICK